MKYRLLAHVVSLHLNKTISFETRVSWKRSTNPGTQTSTRLRRKWPSTGMDSLASTKL